MSRMIKPPCGVDMTLNKGALSIVLVVLSAWSASSQSTSSASTHPCDRACIEGGSPLTCYYSFHIEAYHSLSKACFDCPRNTSDCSRPHCVPAGGVRRSVVVINRQLPGPPIHVCLGDRIIVDVHNDMAEQSTSIHWHGLLQRSNPYMDGVPQITQCPIPPLSAFRYDFIADKPGTHMWHSHSGSQRADGAIGALTVRIPETLDPHKDLYDADLHEHSLVLIDWTLRSATDKFANHFHAGGDNKADTILINGKGRFGRSLCQENDPKVPMPLEEFVVHPDIRYRFRLINAGYLNCPIELSIDNHTMLVIASDGGDLQPVRADVLVSYAGERWDFILDANQEIGSYRIRTRGILDCAPKRAHQEAILRYEGATHGYLPQDDKPSYEWVRRGLHVNPLNKAAGSHNSLTAAELRQLRQGTRRMRTDPELKPNPDMQLLIAYDFFDVNNPSFNVRGLYGIDEVMDPQHRTYTPQLNHISMQFPSFPLLPQRNEIKPNMFCNESTLAAQGRDCRREFCACTHVVDVPLGSVVEVILVDEGDRYDANHPFHLHGHAFRVVSIDRLGKSVKADTVKRLDRAGLIRRNLVDPPVKDTVSVPDGGYAAIRVHFNNPGYWLFHCHIDFHVELGMALVFKIGDHSQMPPAPSGFPQCGNWFGEDEHIPKHTGLKMPQVDKQMIHISDYDDDDEALAVTTKTQQAESNSSVEKVSYPVDKIDLPVEKGDFSEGEAGPIVAEAGLAVVEIDATATEVNSPVTEVNSPVTEVNSPVTEVNSPVTEVNSPVTEVNSPVTEVNSPVTEVTSPVTEANPSVAEIAPIAAEVTPTVAEAVSSAPKISLTIAEVGSTVTKEFTNPTVPDDLATTVPSNEKKYPGGSTELPDTSLSNLKNLYLLYSVAESKSKKDQLSHNEVSKGLTSIIELAAKENLKRKEEVQSFVMKVPPRFRAAVTSDKERSASERKARAGFSLREPALIYFESSAQPELYTSTAVKIKFSFVVPTLVLLPIINLIL